jgi:hypothetical protein
MFYVIKEFEKEFYQMAKTLILLVCPDPAFHTCDLPAWTGNMLKELDFPRLSIPDVIIQAKTGNSPKVAKCLRDAFQAIAGQTVPLHIWKENTFPQQEDIQEQKKITDRMRDRSYLDEEASKERTELADMIREYEAGPRIEDLSQLDDAAQSVLIVIHPGDYVNLASYFDGCNYHLPSQKIDDAHRNFLNSCMSGEARALDLNIEHWHEIAKKDPGSIVQFKRIAHLIKHPQLTFR